jgi:hypothetical protein
MPHTVHHRLRRPLVLFRSIQGIEHLSLGAIQNGVILLCGLFFYGGCAAPDL